MDYLDFANPKPRFTASASYYKFVPDSLRIGAQSFNYEYVNPYSNTYRRLFANIQGDGGEVAIRTDDQLDYIVGGIVVTQDGHTFKIVQVEKDFQSANKQALRLFGTPVSVQYVLRLVVIENPWGYS